MTRLVPVALIGGLALAVVMGAPAHAVPLTDHQMPFPCGETWTGSTRASHSSVKAIDWNRTDDLDDPVVASAPGVVASAVTTDRGGYGKWVRIDHGNSESSLYAHLDSVAVKVGQSVDQGQLVGLLGNTGSSTGPHLHFEERRGSDVINSFFDGVRFRYGSLASKNCVDVPLAGNFVNTAEAELVVYRRAARSQFLIHRPGSTPRVQRMGTASDEPVVGDWDGNGRANLGVRSPSTRTFKLRTPDGPVKIVLGASSDRPVAGDWDGDGRFEVGVRRVRTADFVLRSSGGLLTTVRLGDSDDIGVAGDWNGDKVTDVGVYDQATATYTLRIVDADGMEWTAQVQFGRPGDLPVAGDWDANGKTDLGVWTPATATFQQRQAPSPTSSRVSGTSSTQFGRPR